MSNEIKITKTIEETATDDMGNTGRRDFEAKIQYLKGRGLSCSITTWFESADGSRSMILFGDGNTSFMFLPLKRAAPKVLAEAGRMLEANREEIFKILHDWSNEDLWSLEDRKAAISSVGKILRGELVTA